MHFWIAAGTIVAPGTTSASMAIWCPPQFSALAKECIGRCCQEARSCDELCVLMFVGLELQKQHLVARSMKFPSRCRRVTRGSGTMVWARRTTSAFGIRINLSRAKIVAGRLIHPEGAVRSLRYRQDTCDCMWIGHSYSHTCAIWCNYQAIGSSQVFNFNFKRKQTPFLTHPTSGGLAS